MNQGAKLLKWYQQHKRSMPWRGISNPYRIWVSEVMLQQTTVQTVTPYYKKFIKRFPSLKSLAQSSLKDVLPYWAGLGYYSRVRNLHLSATLFFKEGGMPKTALELQKYLGFGPYTSKAVSSIAFGERVSVLDGNVIRVLCRHQNLKTNWWSEKEKKKLESIASSWSEGLPIGDMNQAFMELGATVCLPQSPLCHQCPLNKTCLSKKLKTTHQVPIKKLRKKKEIWLWQPEVSFIKNKVFLTLDHSCPFLKKSWLFPGKIQKLKSVPKKYDIKHFITHYDIFIQVKKRKPKKTVNGDYFSLREIASINPSSLVKKILTLYKTNSSL